MAHVLGELENVSLDNRAYGDAVVELARVGTGRPLLFLHGEDGLIWSAPVITELSSNFEVIAPHHPGWGGSTVPRHVTDVTDIARLYAELLEDFNEPVAVVGCSFGAWIAAELAVLRPRNLAGLALVAPTGIKAGSREDRDFADIWVANFTDLPGIMYGDATASPSLLGRQDEEYLYLAIAQEATARFCWKPYMHNAKLRHWLRRIDVPCAVLAGDSDHFALLPNYFDTYASLIGETGGQPRVIAGVGHRIEEEAPNEVGKVANELFA